MTPGTKFSENREINSKNGNRIRNKCYRDKSLVPYIKERGFLAVRQQVKQIYHNCKREGCNNELTNNALKIRGVCMCCENG